MAWANEFFPFFSAINWNFEEKLVDFWKKIQKNVFENKSEKNFNQK